MLSIRFKIRTLMIVVAAAGVLVGLVRLSANTLKSVNVWIDSETGTLCFLSESVTTIRYPGHLHGRPIHRRKVTQVPLRCWEVTEVPLKYIYEAAVVTSSLMAIALYSPSIPSATSTLNGGWSTTGKV